jgi:hypothetical protein
VIQVQIVVARHTLKIRIACKFAKGKSQIPLERTVGKIDSLAKVTAQKADLRLYACISQIQQPANNAVPDLDRVSLPDCFHNHRCRYRAAGDRLLSVEDHWPARIQEHRDCIPRDHLRPTLYVRKEHQLRFLRHRNSRQQTASSNLETKPKLDVWPDAKPDGSHFGELRPGSSVGSGEHGFPPKRGRIAQAVLLPRKLVLEDIVAAANKFTDLRNPIAHSQPADKPCADRIRELLLGPTSILKALIPK